MEEYFCDKLSDFGKVKIKKMFGVTAVYMNGKMAGICSNGQCFIKSDKTTENVFINGGSEKFGYVKKDGTMIYMNYWLVHEDLLEDKEILSAIVRPFVI